MPPSPLGVAGGIDAGAVPGLGFRTCREGGGSSTKVVGPSPTMWMCMYCWKTPSAGRPPTPQPTETPHRPKWGRKKSCWPRLSEIERERQRVHEVKIVLKGTWRKERKVGALVRHTTA